MATPQIPIPRPRRSVLFVPGSNRRALERARTLPADGLIFDLEDAVAPAVKEEARTAVAAALAAAGYGARERVLRVNPLDTLWGHADLSAAATMPLDAVLLPKVESADQVRLAAALLEALGAPPERALWCMLETPLGILNSGEIAAASPRLAVLVVGTSDLTNELRASQTADRLPLLPALGLALLAARANRLAALDGVHLDLADDEAFARACRQGRELGFDGKTLIHPKQIETANTAFAPSAEQVAWSRRVIAAHAGAIARGQGLALVDRKLVENLHVNNARRVIAIAEEIARIAAAPSNASFCERPLTPPGTRSKSDG